jgi:hypothetical protein
MADETGTKPPVVTEIIPSQADQVSGIGSLGAPFVYTDWIGNYGHNAGVAFFTLEALRYMTVGGTTRRDRVVVAHLRMPIHTMAALKASIEQVELMLKPAASSEKN